MVKGKSDEHACRINYLFQAAEHVASISPALNEHYGQVLTVVSEKTAAKRDFTLKRSMCKKCRAVLVPGVNMRYRLHKRKHRKGRPTVVITCLNCEKVKRLNTQPGKRLKAEVTGIIHSRQSRQPMKESTTTDTEVTTKTEGVSELQQEEEENNLVSCMKSPKLPEELREPEKSD